MKINKRQLKNLIINALNEAAAPDTASTPSYAETKRQQGDSTVKSKMDSGSKKIRFKSDEQQALEAELVSLNDKAVEAIRDPSTKEKVQRSIDKLMDIVDKGKFNDAKNIALNVYAGELGDEDTDLKATLQGYDTKARSIIIKLVNLNADAPKSEQEDTAASIKPEPKPKPKKKGLSSSAKDKVKKIQTIIGVKADGSWGPKTTAAWKTWIVSPETKAGIKSADLYSVLTQAFLETNAGKAGTIAKKAGYAANLQGVHDLVTTISDALIPIEDEVDDEDSVAPGEYVADGELTIDDVPIYSVTVKADGKVTYATDYDNSPYSRRLSDQVGTKDYVRMKMQASSGTKPSKEDIFSEIEAGNSLKRDETGTGPLKETKIRRMIRQIVLENLRKA